jgi:hypothetical protein
MDRTSKRMRKEVSFPRTILERRFFVDEGNPAVGRLLENEDWLKQIGFATVCEMYSSPVSSNRRRRGLFALAPESKPLAYTVLPSVPKVSGIFIPNGSSGFELFRFICVRFLARRFEMKWIVADRLKAVGLESVRHWLCQRQLLPGEKIRGKQLGSGLFWGGAPFPDLSAPALGAQWYSLPIFIYHYWGKATCLFECHHNRLERQMSSCAHLNRVISVSHVGHKKTAVLHRRGGPPAPSD